MLFCFKKDALGKEKKNVIPLGALLQRIMNTQGIMEELETYDGDDKDILARKILQHPFGRASTVKMNMPSVQYFLAENEKSSEEF